MPDEITATGAANGAQFQPHPEGQFAAVCVDTIDLGEKLEQFPGSDPKTVHKAVILFRTGEKNDAGALIDVGVEYTVSMNEKANLRKFLEAMRGKRYTDEQAAAGVPLHKLVGHAALISIAHQQSRAGRTYAKLQAVMPLPKAMVAPEIGEYARPAFYGERKDEYAAEAARWRNAQHATKKATDNTFDDFPSQLDEEDDDLPF